MTRERAPTRRLIERALRRRLAEREGKKWMSKAFAGSDRGRLHRYFGVPEGEDIPVRKMVAKYRELSNKKRDLRPNEESLRKALQLALTAQDALPDVN